MHKTLKVAKPAIFISYKVFLKLILLKLNFRANILAIV